MAGKKYKEYPVSVHIENRKHTRYEEADVLRIQIKTKGKLFSESWSSADTLDISAGGMRLESKKPHKIGALLKVVINDFNIKI